MGRPNHRVPGLIKIGGIWHIDKRGKHFPGGRLRESTGCRSLEEATAYTLKRLEDCRQAAVFGVRRKRSFEEAATKYLEDNMHKRSIADDASHLRQLMPFIGQLPLDQVHDETLAPFAKHRLAQGIKQKSINNALGVVRRILNLAARSWRENGLTWLATAPLITLPAVTDARSPYPLAWDEQIALFERLPSHLRRMALFAVNTGTREQEVCGLRWRWEQAVPQLDTSVFVVPAEAVKNGEERLVVLNRTAAAIIDTVRGDHPEFVFTSSRGKPIGTMNNNTWQRRRIETALGRVRQDPDFVSLRESVTPAADGEIVVRIACIRRGRRTPFAVRYTTSDYDAERCARGLKPLSATQRRDADLRQSLLYKAREKLLAGGWREYEGLSNVRVHDLKHTFGRRLRAAGVPVETRRVLLGHKNGDITTHYSAPEIGELIEAANRVCARKMPEVTLLKSTRG